MKQDMNQDISFAEIMLRRGTALLEGGIDEDEGDAEAEASANTVDLLARLLATVALTDGPLVVQTEGGSNPALFEEAARIASGSLNDKAAALAAAVQIERAVVFEFDGIGRLSGNRVVTAVLRPEERPDLLEAYVAVGRLRGDTLEMTVAPATVRFDAGALGRTLGLLRSSGLSANAIGAAMAHASDTRAMAGHGAVDVPPVMLDLCWHAFCLASVRGRTTGTAAATGATLH